MQRGVVVDKGHRHDLVVGLERGRELLTGAAGAVDQHAHLFVATAVDGEQHLKKREARDIDGHEIDLD